MRVNALLKIACGMLLTVQAWAFDEGFDYTKLAKPRPTESGDKIEVLEAFAYTCPHCFHLEPTLREWLATKPENVAFKRMPVIFGEQFVPHAKAYYAAEVLEKTAQFHLPLFRALHQDKQQLWDEDALVAFAESRGIDGEEFRRVYNSFFVAMRVQGAREMGEQFGIKSVPAMIVNGKYRTSPSQTGGRERMLQVVDYLIGVETEHAAAPADEPSEAATAVPEP